jgi:hypothetical protein
MKHADAESHFTVVTCLGDVSKIPTAYTEEDFADTFFASFLNSDVSIHSITNVVFLARRLIKNFARDSSVRGRRLVTLY